MKSNPWLVTSLDRISLAKGRRISSIVATVACPINNGESQLVSRILMHELAVCEGCGRAVEWPNGTPTLARRDQE